MHSRTANTQNMYSYVLFHSQHQHTNIIFIFVYLTVKNMLTFKFSGARIMNLLTPREIINKAE